MLISTLMCPDSATTRTQSVPHYKRKSMDGTMKIKYPDWRHIIIGIAVLLAVNQV